MNLLLKRPLVFFDLETTGVDVLKDRIVEISIVKVGAGNDGSFTTNTWRVNPEIHIPEAATAVHHITDDDVKDSPTFKQIAKNVAATFEGADIAGYNSNRFDIPLLSEEFLRAGVDFDFRRHKFVDVQTIFHKMEKRNLESAYRFYCNKELDNAHSAFADTMATFEVLKAQLDKYPSLKNDVEWLSEFSSFNKNVDLSGRIIYNDNKEEVFNFGKHKGKRVEDVFKSEPSYFAWILDGDFSLDTKRVIQNIKLRMLNNK